jgi:hypothetical protein
MDRRSILGVGLAAALPVGVASAAQAAQVEVWKDLTYGCYDGWVRHMRAAGFEATIQDTADLHAIKVAKGVPDALQSCPTATVGGYVIEATPTGNAACSLNVPGQKAWLRLGCRCPPQEWTFRVRSTRSSCSAGPTVTGSGHAIKRGAGPGLRVGPPVIGDANPTQVSFLKDVFCRA